MIESGRPWYSRSLWNNNINRYLKEIMNTKSDFTEWSQSGLVGNSWNPSNWEMEQVSVQQAEFEARMGHMPSCLNNNDKSKPPQRTYCKWVEKWELPSTQYFLNPSKPVTWCLLSPEPTPTLVALGIEPRLGVALSISSIDPHANAPRYLLASAETQISLRT